jgi:hypothetical protein
MAALIGRENVSDGKGWFVYSAVGNEKRERHFPDCTSRGEFYDALRRDLNLPPSTSDRDVVLRLTRMTWNGTSWTDDRPI